MPGCPAGGPRGQHKGRQPQPLSLIEAGPLGPLVFTPHPLPCVCKCGPHSGSSPLPGAQTLCVPTKSGSTPHSSQGARRPRAGGGRPRPTARHCRPGREPRRRAPRPLSPPPPTNRARALNADTEQSDPPFQGDADSMDGPFHVCLWGKTSHFISD